MYVVSIEPLLSVLVGHPAVLTEEQPKAASKMAGIRLSSGAFWTQGIMMKIRLSRWVDTRAYDKENRWHKSHFFETPRCLPLPLAF